MICNHDACKNQHIIDHKHTIVLLDNHADHRKQANDALLSFYNVLEFVDTHDLIPCLHAIRPAILLVDTDIPPLGGYKLVEQLRRDPILRQTPVIMLLTRDTTANRMAVSECGADDWMVKPFLRSNLIRKMSDLLNRRVEKEWKQLSSIQSQSLRQTVESFNIIADNIANGEPILYESVSEACAPLVEAVNTNNFLGILHGVRNHDNYTYVHSLRVATMLALFGNAINLPLHEQKMLATGGLLHDIGKMSIPHNVLNKPGKLNPDEFTVMKSHVTETIRCLELNSDIPKGIITIAGQHHEKLDGTGYPYGLEGSQLNDLARMAAIVDIFSALTDRRVYKPPIPAEEVLAIMTDEMSRHIDIQMLSLFKERFLDALRTI